MLRLPPGALFCMVPTGDGPEALIMKTFAKFWPWAALILLAGCEGLEIKDPSSLLIPTMHRSEIVGFLAGLGTTFAALPDLLSMLRKRSSEGMNPRMASIMLVFQFLWVYYGLLIASRPVILWNVVAIVINTLTVTAYMKFKKKDTN